MKREMQLALDAVRAHLADRFGERVTNARAVLEAHGGSEAYHAPQPPDLVAFPESTDEVREIVGICAARGVPIVPFGAGTSLEGNASSPRGGLCLDTLKMKSCLGDPSRRHGRRGSAGDPAQTTQFRFAPHGPFLPD